MTADLPTYQSLGRGVFFLSPSQVRLEATTVDLKSPNWLLICETLGDGGLSLGLDATRKGRRWVRTASALSP